MFTIVIVAIVIALLFDFLNGMNDAANSIATIVSTRVLSPTAAVAWAALFDDTGATTTIGMVSSNGGSNAGVKTIGGDVILRNTLVYSSTTGLIMGKLEGIAGYGTGAVAGIANAETVVINGVTWRACYNTNLSFFEMA